MHPANPPLRHPRGPVPANGRRGAMMVFIGVLMVIFIVGVAMSIEYAHIQLARTELRTATDAAAKAAALELSRSQDVDTAIATGTRVASENLIIGRPLLLSPSDFRFGNSAQDRVSGRFDFRDADTPINSVRVDGKRTTASRGGGVALFFGGFFNVPFFEPTSTATATFINRDVVLVVDRSGSMAGRLLRDLRAAVATFTRTLAETPVDEFVGLASYAEFASADALLTPDLAAIDRAANRLVADGWTSISRGMEAGEEVFRSGRSARFVERTMIVMTDGNHNRGPEPRIVAQELANDGVVIHTITFGGEADLVRMREVARIGRGRHYHAANGAELAQIYREIALSLSTLITQ